MAWLLTTDEAVINLDWVIVVGIQNCDVVVQISEQSQLTAIYKGKDRELTKSVFAVLCQEIASSRLADVSCMISLQAVIDDAKNRMRKV